MPSFDRFLDWRRINLSSLSIWMLGNLATPAAGLLTLVFAQSLAQFTWDFFWFSPTQPLPPARASVVTQAHTVQNSSVDTVLQTHLFGKPKVVESAKIAPVPVASIPVPTRNPTSAETSEAAIRFTLRGIMAGEPSGAIISWPGEPDRFFRVGGKLSGGSIVQKIQADQVILSREGKLTTLSLSRELLPDSSSFFGWNIEKTETKRDKKEENTRGEKHNPIKNGVSLNQYRSRILENPNNLEKIVRTQPIYKSGRLEGFRLRPGSEGEALFDQYGLQPNDLLVSLNGIPLDDPLKAIQVLQSMRDASEVDLGIIREGRAETVKLQFSRK
ncbi:general secretion pathway protein C [Gammaproteobacteria bacterium]